MPFPNHGLGRRAVTALRRDPSRINGGNIVPNHKKKPPAPAEPAAPSKSAEALALVKNDMAAIAPADFAVINVDIPQAVSVVLGVVPHLKELRPQIVSSLPDHPLATFDKLETYALAAYHAHVLWLPPETADNRVGALVEEATSLRENLLGDAEALARRKLLDADAVAAIRAGSGNIDKANDLVALSALFTSKWSEIQHKTATTHEEVLRAAELGPLLLAALGARDHGVSMEPAAAEDQRRRAFTLFMRAYSETRRAVLYLRWHEGDAELLAPSLYKGRGGRGGAANGKQEPPGSAEPAPVAAPSAPVG